MAISVACPKCQAHLEITDDLVDQPIRCHRCENIFRRGDDAAHANGIQVGTARRGPAGQPREDEPPPSRPHATARAPFPMVPLLVLVCGLLVLLLVLSGGFNFWLIAHPDIAFNRDEVRMLQAQAAEANERAAQARQQEEQARREAAELKRRLDRSEQTVRELEKRLGKK
ncbi:MAG TPA: hypothetical protein VFE62_28025 [Gemmataceae bacterium]|nr:hypothetical protein [Gemmataceae bacterium]